MRADLKPIAITIGDAAGIGPEIIVKAFCQAPDQFDNCIVVGDQAVMQRAWQVVAAKTRSLPKPMPMNMPMQEELSIQQVGSALGQEQLPALGKISVVAGQLAADSITWAAQAAMRGEVSAIVTAPLHKEALSLSGVKFPGHTEMFQALAAQHLHTSIDQLPVRMMLANRELKTVLVTIHQPLRQAIDAITVDNILETLRITHRAELAFTGRAPHLAVAGLNPHAGEGGLLGQEEIDIIQPAIEIAKAEGMIVSGPWSPDTVFMRARAERGQPGAIDVVVAMYHDQGLIPVKYLGVEKGVNITLGLPFVRTSPDHGTAFDLAGKGVADPSSLLEALVLARRLAGVGFGA
ncbi:MAG: 4-hydroxythreonine-4-phosphate dehydrogenase PdxA [Betaproteobacteria bacterium]|jgi:4-hydroxythreonine-4-phosphate dehydrogenase|nr:4-hydroxythreonine-4-phosphate dehydrogenase PdxA [Betaproteobacteria bacterium]